MKTLIKSLQNLFIVFDCLPRSSFSDWNPFRSLMLIGISFLFGCSSYVEMVRKDLQFPSEKSSQRKYVVLYQPTSQELLGYVSREDPPQSEGPLEKDQPNPCFVFLQKKQISPFGSARSSSNIKEPMVEKAGIGIPDPNSPCSLQPEKVYSVITEQVRAKELIWKGEDGPKDTYSKDMILAVRLTKIKPVYQEAHCSFTSEHIGVSCSFPQERGVATLARVDSEKNEYFFSLRRSGNDDDQKFMIDPSLSPRVCQSGENGLKEDESCIYPLTSSSAVLLTLVKEEKHYVLQVQLKASYLMD